MPDIPETERKLPPQAVVNARIALGLLAAENASLTAVVEKILPPFALRLEKQGADFSPAALLDHARQGLEHLKAPPENAAPRLLTVKELIKAKHPRRYDTKQDHGLNDPLIRNRPALQRAAANGDLRALSASIRAWQKKNPSPPHVMTLEYGALRFATYQGHINAVKMLLERIPSLGERFAGSTLLETCRFEEHADKKLEIMDMLIKTGHTSLQAKHNALLTAVSSGNKKAIRLLIENGAQKDYNKNQPLEYALIYENVEMLKFLVEDCGVNPAYGGSLIKAVDKGNYDAVEYLASRGRKLPLSLLHPEGKYQRYLKNRKEWEAVTHHVAPEGLEYLPAALFRPVPFKTAQEILRLEMDEGDNSRINRLAFHVSALFETEQRMLEYWNRWGKRASMSFHDITYDIQIPEQPGPMNIQAWADASLKFGPEMAFMTSLAGKMPAPEKSADGKTWSIAATREKASLFSYARADENPELAKLCHYHLMPEEDFEKALAVAKKIPKAKNIPEITIDGENFGMPGASFYRLAANDPRGLILGQMTDCCQSIGSEGDDCARHGYTSPNGGFYVVENARKEIIGQTWAWRGAQGEMCFDTLETLGENVKAEHWTKILRACAEELSAKTSHDVTRLTVGKGGDTPASLRNIFNSAAPAAVPKKYRGYRESNKQFLIWDKKAIAPAEPRQKATKQSVPR